MRRYVHATAPRRVKLQQLEWCAHTPSWVVKATARGLALATLAEYSALDKPVLIINGAEDSVTPPEQAYAIYGALPRRHGPYIIPKAGHSVMVEHAALVNALITNFLVKQPELACLRVTPVGAERLADLSRSKWALKNHTKWSITQSAGAVVGGTDAVGGLLGIKTMRQDDTEHSPATFQARHPHVGLVVDLSREAPPYLTTDAALHGYSKLATVSKMCPSRDQVAAFVSLVDAFHAAKDTRRMHVAVHCHYGFNRTGFMICAYLVERRGVAVEDAVRLFAASRPPGIKHKHFEVELLRRYGTQ